MAYDKQTWANLPAQTTPVSAERLKHVEDGIGDAHDLTQAHVDDTEAHSSGASLPVGGLTGQALVKASDTDDDVEWGVGHGKPLARVVYRPTGTVYSVTSGAGADVDATNLAITFKVPASGAVVVRLKGHGNVQTDSTASSTLFFYLREGAATVSASEGVVMSNGADRLRDCTMLMDHEIRLSGLTPGDTKTWKWAWWVEGGGGQTGRLRVGPASPSGQAPAVMEVWAA